MTSRLHACGVPLALATTLLAACADVAPPTAPHVVAARGAEPAPIAGSVVPGSIAFTSTRDGIAELYVMNPGSRHVTRLTVSGADVEWNQQPDWSPDGTKLLFTRRTLGGAVHDVHVLDLTEPDPQPRRLIVNPAPSGSPVWSPDGRMVAYCSFNAGAPGGATPQIWIHDLVTGSSQPLGTGAACWPDWSPDGSEIAYHTLGANPEIVVMDLATRAARVVAPGPAQDVQPEWSPDGTQLVFRSNRDRDAAGTRYFALFLVPADGSAPPTNITPIPDGVLAAQWSHDVPTWSHDGAKVLVAARRPDTGTSFQLFQINVHSGHAKQLTDEAGNSFLPSVRSISRP